MKTRCRHCLAWIVFSRRETCWWHLDSGNVECANPCTVATRDATLPLMPLLAGDRARVEAAQ